MLENIETKYIYLDNNVLSNIEKTISSNISGNLNNITTIDTLLSMFGY